MAILHHWQFDFNFYLICTLHTNIWLLIRHAIGLNLILTDLLKHVVAFLFVCAQAYPTKEFFAVAEKGNHPNIVVYEYPSLRPYRILKGKGDLEALSNFFFFSSLQFWVFLPSSPRWHWMCLQLCGFQPRWKPAGQCGKRTWLYADAVGLEARAGVTELQGYFSGGLQSDLFPIWPGFAHIFRISTHQVKHTLLNPF